MPKSILKAIIILMMSTMLLSGCESKSEKLEAKADKIADSLEGKKVVGGLAGKFAFLIPGVVSESTYEKKVNKMADLTEEAESAGLGLFTKIGIAVVAVIVLILVLKIALPAISMRLALGGGRRGRRHRHCDCGYQQPVVVQQPVCAPQAGPALPCDYMSLLAADCASLGLDPNKMLSRYGDARTAYEKVHSKLLRG